ncbi:sulfatase-like hydrolase/transferase [Glaciecola sp. SC05]|uniref:sulfatase-like hydrolase/transferase n=1 Tax=Glaciecola sp. SC05 TaxID=1987355 RepID=UPI003529AF28
MFVRFSVLLGSIFLGQGCAVLSNEEATKKTTAQAPIKNILFIAIDDLRPELKSFGAAHIHSPNIDELAESSRLFFNHFVNSPSCGPSRYSLLTGRYGHYSNQSIQARGKALLEGSKQIAPSMPAWFKSHGYTTVSVGKVSHYPGGKIGKNWDDATQLEMPNSWTKSLMPVGEWGTPKGAMHGLAFGEVRINASKMSVFQAVEGDDNIYPDGLITEEAIRQLQQLSKSPENPFFLAVGLIRPHLHLAHLKNISIYTRGLSSQKILSRINHKIHPLGSTRMSL